MTAVTSRIISDTYENYAKSGGYEVLLSLMPTSRLSRESKYAYTKTSIEYLWFILATLTRVFGKRKFNSCVGLRHWDIDLVMVDAPVLTTPELIKGFVEMKRLLSAHGLNPNNGAYTTQVVEQRLMDIWVLGKPPCAVATALPRWDEINPKMKIC